MTQPQLATATGLKQSSLSELETGETKEISGPALIAISKALRVRPEWIVTGDEPMETDPAAALSSDERDMLELYRGASNRWKVAIKYMASLRADAHQDLAAESMNVVFARIAAEPVPDYRLGDRWTRPDKKKPPPEEPEKP